MSSQERLVVAPPYARIERAMISFASLTAIASMTTCSLMAPNDDEFVGGGRDAGVHRDVASPGVTRDARNDGNGGSDRDRENENDAGSDADPTPRPCDGGCGATELCVSDAGLSGCVAPAAELDGQRWDLVCGAPYGSNSCRLYPPGTTSCPDNGYYPVNRNVVFGGEKGKLYDLTLRFRGVVEPKTYTGGTPAGDSFYIGGQPSPSNYNAYGFSVSAPAPIARYYLNFEPTRGESPYILTFDYQRTIPIEGGATINLSAYTQQCGLMRNCTVPSVPPAPCTPLVIESLMPPANPDGHVIQVNVISVTERG